MKPIRGFNNKFFYKVFAFLIMIVLMCSLTISLTIYYRFELTMSRQNMDFIANTSEQMKTSILNLMKGYEIIAGNIYSDATIHTFLRNDYQGEIDYAMFEKINFINNTFEGIRNNNINISQMCLYKINPNLIADGKNIINMDEFEKPELLKKAIGAKGRDVWTAYPDQNSNGFNIALLKHINVMNPGGILKIEMTEQSFFDLYSSEASKKYILFIIDSDYRVISSNQRDIIGKELAHPVKDYLLGNPTGNKLHFNKNSYYVFHEQVKNDWSLVLLYNSNEIEKEKRYMAYYILTFTGIFMLIALFCSLFFSSRFASQVDKLLVKIKEIEKGNLNIQPTIKKVNEFHILDKTLCIMAHRIDKLKTDMYQSVKQKEESDMKYLQMQMNPHFLYNLLSAVRWIAFHNKQDRIIFIIDHLSNFYKIALSKGNEIIDIEAEINLVNSFTALQNLFYNDRISLNVHLDEVLAGLKVCKMTLQPFIENSIVHGRVHGKDLNISIDIRKSDNAVKIRIEDDGAGISEEFIQYIEKLDTKSIVSESACFGITNTLARLCLLYGGNIRISAVRLAPGTLIELIIYPQ